MPEKTEKKESKSRSYLKEGLLGLLGGTAGGSALVGSLYVNPRKNPMYNLLFGYHPLKLHEALYPGHYKYTDIPVGERKIPLHSTIPELIDDKKTRSMLEKHKVLPNPYTVGNIFHVTPDLVGSKIEYYYDPFKKYPELNSKLPKFEWEIIAKEKLDEALKKHNPNPTSKKQLLRNALTHGNEKQQLLRQLHSFLDDDTIKILSNSFEKDKTWPIFYPEHIRQGIEELKFVAKNPQKRKKLLFKRLGKDDLFLQIIRSEIESELPNIIKTKRPNFFRPEPYARPSSLHDMKQILSSLKPKLITSKEKRLKDSPELTMKIFKKNPELKNKLKEAVAVSKVFRNTNRILIGGGLLSGLGSALAYTKYKHDKGQDPNKLITLGVGLLGGALGGIAALRGGAAFARKFLSKRVKFP